MPFPGMYLLSVRQFGHLLLIKNSSERISRRVSSEKSSFFHFFAQLYAGASQPGNTLSERKSGFSSVEAFSGIHDFYQCYQYKMALHRQGAQRRVYSFPLRAKKTSAEKGKNRLSRFRRAAA